MAETKSARRIGDILISYGIINQEMLDHALNVSHEYGERLGETLLRMGLIAPGQLTWALKDQFDLCYVDLSSEIVDWNLLTNLPLRRLRKLTLLPMSCRDGAVVAVVADPTREYIGATLDELFPRQRQEVHLADPEAIEAIFDEAELRTAWKMESDLVGREAHPDTSTLSPMLRAIESGALESLVIAYSLQSDGIYKAVCSPPLSDQPAVMSEVGLQTIRSYFEKNFTAEMNVPGGFCAIRAGVMSHGTRPIRAVWIQGLRGPLFAVQGVPIFGKKDRQPSRLVLVAGDDPSAIKSALYQQEFLMMRKRENEVPAVALEANAESLAGSVFQAEIPDSAQRIAMAPRVMAALPRGTVIVELDGPEDLPRLAPAAAHGGGLVIALSARPVGRNERIEVPHYAQSLFLHDDPSQWHQQIKTTVFQG